MIINFEQAILTRLCELNRIEEQRSLNVEEMDEFMCLFEKYQRLKLFKQIKRKENTNG